MKSNALVYITTIHKTEDGHFPIEIKTFGIYKKINDYHYIDYEYADEESDSRIKTLIKATGTRVEVNTSGDSKYRMVFDKKEEHISRADIGNLQTSIKQVTKKVSLEETNDGIILFIDYELFRGKELMTACEMVIKTEYTEDKTNR